MYDKYRKSFFTEKYDFYKGKEKTDFLFHIDKLKIKKGGLYVIKGENGSGKSMFLNLLFGNVKLSFSRGGFILTDEMDEADIFNLSNLYS
ncbi:MAG: ATP-binding cassette domain-containing protein [Roseburia inulinivorans]